jgi:hypothetical protein
MGLAKAVLIVTAIGVGGWLLFRPYSFTPQMMIEVVLKERSEGDFEPFSPENLVGGDDIARWTTSGALRGLGPSEANEMLNSCSNPADWVHLGDEGPVPVDGLMEPFRYSIMECRRERGSIFARLWMSRELVDNHPDLIAGSYFLACSTGLCPDLAVGDPPVKRLDGHPRPFKVQTGPAK